MVSNLEVQYTRFFSVLRHKMYAPTFFSKVELISSIQNVSKKKKNLFVKFEKKLFFWVDSYVIVKVNIPGACLAKRTEFRHCKFVFGIVDFWKDYTKWLIRSVNCQTTGKKIIKFLSRFLDCSHWIESVITAHQYLMGVFICANKCAWKMFKRQKE